MGLSLFTHLPGYFTFGYRGSFLRVGTGHNRVLHAFRRSNHALLNARTKGVGLLDDPIMVPHSYSIWIR